MHWIDWSIVGLFMLISLSIGLAVRHTSGRNLEAYFVSNRRLGWWLAGTSIAATAFSSDTPLLLTGMVRRRGIWGAWEVWALAISTMFAVYFFSRLWKRANIMTEVQLTEVRYSGRAAAFLRGFKALYWGLFYNCYVIGVWPVTGMSKVLQETTGWNREATILASVLLGTWYTSVSGLWGVVLTDAFQFVWAMVGAFVLAAAAVQAAGGFDAIASTLAGTGSLGVIPPGPQPGEPLLSSPFGWFLGLVLVQWWAWKNTDGGGIVVQRLVSCKDERQALRSVLWFNVAHYALRSWPWVITAAASLVLISDAQLQTTVAGVSFVDHELAYPRLITQLLSTGWRGFLVASFFAAFLSTISTQLNWGSSYLVNDVYKRFLRRDATEQHYLRLAKALPFALAAGAVAVAWTNRSIGASFTWILNLTAGIGPVLLLRWFWWRINPWSEIAAMTASLPVLLLRPHAMAWLGLPAGLLPELLFMVLGTGLVWLPVTLATPAVDRGTLKQFYVAVRPPGAWRPVALPSVRREPWGRNLACWLLGTVAVLGITVGPIQLMLGPRPVGAVVCLVAGAAWWGVIRWGRDPATGRSGPGARQAADAR